ncbi:MAG: hypothetical protein GWN71_14615, partial [Gammaproteobacteria bacterium]|nr:hypothetical protein [Gemmatimonadota bacterium]NIU74762.1 hypothetical protein [Gammaproteobacteria bacterium]
TARLPLAQVSFALTASPPEHLELYGGLELEAVEVVHTATAKFDLSLVLLETPQ